MSSLTAARLYALLPAVYRIRDEQQGKPLHALVSLIAQELEALEENVEQLYDDQFIETCAPWVAPYIGDLIGYRPLHGVTATTASPRAEVANTIVHRRRKGTAAMLEQLARDVTDCPARAVEFFEQLATTQYMNHVRLQAPATADLRSSERMLYCGGPFNRVAHTPDMRRPETGSGRYNIPNVGIFLWRLRPFPLSDVPLTRDRGDTTGRKFRFNFADQPLYRLPVVETAISHIAGPLNVPAPLRIRELAVQLREAQRTSDVLSETQDYGAGRSFVLRRAGAVIPINRAGPPGDPPSPAVPELRIADLRDMVDGNGVVTGWAHEAGLLPAEIAIDPERGRVLLGSDRAVEQAADPFVASFYYGFSRPIGGGQYARTLTGESLATQQRASQGDDLQPHLDEVRSGGRLVITDSLTYTQQAPVFKVDGVTTPGALGLEVVVTAASGASGARPLIAAGGPVTLEIGARGRLVLEGLTISGGPLTLHVSGDDEPRELILRHCTLIPGLALNGDGTAASPGAPSLTIDHPFLALRLEQCIVGALRVETDAAVELVDCIVDAGDPTGAAFAGSGADRPGGALTIRDSTVIGKVHTRLMTLASNTIFFSRLTDNDTWKAPVWADRKQAGCVRFSVVPEGSLVPRRFRCVPSAEHPDVLPHFTSLRYGDPGYAQLRSATDASIRRGADDEGEIGVMHALYQPQREANLRIRLDEYLRFGLHAGIVYVT